MLENTVIKLYFVYTLDGTVKATTANLLKLKTPRSNKTVFVTPKSYDEHPFYFHNYEGSLQLEWAFTIPANRPDLIRIVPILRFKISKNRDILITQEKKRNNFFREQSGHI